jgi:hypothetical protein
VSKDVLTLLFAGLAVLFGFLAYRIGRITLTYMRGRDFELDTRNGWIEIHKAMVNLRVHRELIMLPGKMAAFGVSAPSQPGAIADYSLAAAQLRAQLDRLNDDPLIIELANFLDDNKLTAQWQADEYAQKFDKFVYSVAMKSRPK